MFLFTKKVITSLIYETIFTLFSMILMNGVRMIIAMLGLADLLFLLVYFASLGRGGRPPFSMLPHGYTTTYVSSTRILQMYIDFHIGFA